MTIFLLRTEKKISQDELAELTKTSQGWIARLERGHFIPGLFEAEKISLALSYPIQCIIDEARREVLPEKEKAIRRFFNHPKRKNIAELVLEKSASIQEALDHLT